jgi:predicted MFS family arabinose efflux permease
VLLDRIERGAAWAVLAVALAIVVSAWFSVPVRQDDPRTPSAISQLKR